MLKGTSDATLVAPFNNLAAIERLFEKHPGEIAGVIVEPIMMNIAFCMPDEGYLPALRELCRKNGAMFIMDEVKTGGKLAWGGACEYFKVKPDIVCLGKSIGGGFSLAAFGAIARNHGRDCAAEDVSCRHLQHESGGDGGRLGNVPRMY